MSEPLPKYWIHTHQGEEVRYKLVCLANAAKTWEPLYIMEDRKTGMNVAIPFGDPDLRVDDE